jgi:hypothetical protein
MESICTFAISRARENASKSPNQITSTQRRRTRTAEQHFFGLEGSRGRFLDRCSTRKNR